MLDAKKMTKKLDVAISPKLVISEDSQDKMDAPPNEWELWDKIKKSSVTVNNFSANGTTYKLAVIENVVKSTGLQFKAYVSLDKKYYVRSINNEVALWNKPIVLNLHTFYPDGVMEFVSWV